MKQLNEKALIINLRISQWTGRKLDRRANETIAAAHATDGQVGNFHKRLLPGAEQLERIGTLAGNIRKFWHYNTLPWLADGSRIISSEHYLEFMTEFRRLKADFDSAVSNFIETYPGLRMGAMVKLGSLFSIEDYPEPEQLPGKFSCEVLIFPVPTLGDFRVEIGETEKAEFQNHVEQSQKAMVQDCWNRAHEVVSKAVDRLTQDSLTKTGKARIHPAVLENILETCKILHRLNIFNDPNLESVALKLESMVSTLSLDDLKTNSTDRETAAKELATILDSMGAFMTDKTNGGQNEQN